MSAVIIAGGFSKRFGSIKGLIEFQGKPLIIKVIDRVSSIVDEIVVVVSSNLQKRKFHQHVKNHANIIIDKESYRIRTPLVGALSGFNSINNEKTFLLACDTPFISSRILKFLLDASHGNNAIIPKWPNSQIEPLQAVFDSRNASKAAINALNNKEYDMRSMIRNLKDVYYISTEKLKQFDPELLSFFNINTPSDLKKAELLNHHTY